LTATTFFLPWIERELPFSERTAYNYISLYQWRDKVATVANLQDAYKKVKQIETKEKQKERREIDPIMLFEYIGMLRKGYDGKGRNQYAPSSQDEAPTQDNIKKKTGKGSEFVSAADKFNALSEEDKEEVRRWYREED